MSKVEICPVCEKSGNYNDSKCHGCDGKGWILIYEATSFDLPTYRKPLKIRRQVFGDPNPHGIWDGKFHTAQGIKLAH